MELKEPVLNTMLKSSMKYGAERQEVVARNLANIDTPGYKARDLKKLDFKKLAMAQGGQLQMAATAPTHLGGTLGAAGGNVFASEADRSTFETTPTQNNVVLEEQMGKISDIGAQFQLSSTMLKKYTSLYRSALGQR